MYSDTSYALIVYFLNETRKTLSASAGSFLSPGQILYWTLDFMKFYILNNPLRTVCGFYSNINQKRRSSVIIQFYSHDHVV